jgi:CRISPR system Cascade subunit CasE
MSTLNQQSKPAPDRVFLTRLRFKALRGETVRTLGDSHRLHCWIYAAFPRAEEGGPGRVLWRIEKDMDNGPRQEISVLVQSEKSPDLSRWTTGGWVCGVDGPRTVPLRDADGVPLFPEGTRFRFRLRANPTFRVGKDDPKGAEEIRKGKRLSVTCKERREEYVRQNGLSDEHISSARVAEALLAEWIGRKGKDGGFTLPSVPTSKDWFDPFGDGPASRLDIRITPEGFRRGWRDEPCDSHRTAIRSGNAELHQMDHDAVLFEGTLTVTNGEAFIGSLANGIGSAKGFGFGLLSLKRL